MGVCILQKGCPPVRPVYPFPSIFLLAFTSSVSLTRTSHPRIRDFPTLLLWKPACWSTMPKRLILTGFLKDKTQVIVIQVPASSQAHRFKNKFFDRSVDGDFELRTDAEISALYLRKSTLYTENTIYPYLRIEDFKDGIVNKARNLIHSMRENHPWLELDDMELFRQANLYRRDVRTGEEGFTLAALMLFGKDEVIQSALPYYKIDCVLRRVNTDRYDDRFTSFGNIIDGYSELMSFFERYFPDTFYMEGDQRVSLRNKVFREVVSNLLIHREYLNPSISCESSFACWCYHSGQLHTAS